MRLNAYLARAGIASRRGSDDLIKEGRVKVNDEPGQLNTYVHAGDRVEVDGEPVAAQQLTYVLLNKPAGTVTTASDPQGRPTVVQLVDDVPERIVPVGRLDADTTGALLLTNDGALAHRLAHPRYGVEKVYEVDVEGEPSAEAISSLAAGVELDDGVTAPAQARVLQPSTDRADVARGAQAPGQADVLAVGHPVRRLHRARYAGLTVEGLEPGQWRELEPSEVKRLRTLLPEP